ncbi:hypothetical protein FOCC_FOCC002513, partial [Frankliniella occidentalis]
MRGATLPRGHPGRQRRRLPQGQVPRHPVRGGQAGVRLGAARRTHGLTPTVWLEERVCGPRREPSGGRVLPGARRRAAAGVRRRPPRRTGPGPPRCAGKEVRRRGHAEPAAAARGHRPLPGPRVCGRLEGDPGRRALRQAAGLPGAAAGRAVPRGGAAVPAPAAAGRALRGGLRTAPALPRRHPLPGRARRLPAGAPQPPRGHPARAQAPGAVHRASAPVPRLEPAPRHPGPERAARPEEVPGPGAGL